MKRESQNNIKRIRIIIIIACIIAAILIAFAIISHRPKTRLLLSILDFKNNTMEDTGFLAYDIDLMEFCREYCNADVTLDGEVGLNNVKNVNASIFADIKGKRSYEQKKLSIDTKLELVFIEAGHINYYAEDKTIYMDAPILGNSTYAFNTGLNLFPHMPNLTEDPNQAWYNENLNNIINLIKDIDLEKIFTDYKDEEGKACEAFKATIHEGTGHFIWELLGMDDPDFDVSLTFYITKDNKIRRVEADISDFLEGGYVILEGKSLGKLTFTYKLPEEESAKLTLERSSAYDKYIAGEIDYYTNTDVTYALKSAIKWQKTDKGFSMEIKDMSLTKNDELICDGYFIGDINKANFDDDVFEGQEDYLYGFEQIDWKLIRDDTEGFVKQILAKMSLGQIIANFV